MVYRKRFTDTAKQNAYRNACDCLYYGYGQSFWDDCGIDEMDRKEVWIQAKMDMGNDLREV